MDFSDILSQVNGWGPYQRRRVFIIILLAVLIDVQGHYRIVLMLMTPPFWCQTLNTSSKIVNTSLMMNTTIVHQTTFLPEHPITDPYEIDQCEHHQQYLSSLNSTLDYHYSSCSENDEWVFNSSIIGRTAVTDFFLVCGRRWLLSATITIHTIALMLGSSILLLTDRYGRKTVTVVATIVNLIFSVISVVANSMPGFMVCTFFTSFTADSVFNGALLWVLEFVEPSKRSSLIISQVAIFGLITSYTGVLAMLCQNWIHFGLYFCIAPVFLTLLAIYFVPESPSWLFSREYDKTKAIEVLKRIAIENGRNLDPDVQLQIDVSPNSFDQSQSKTDDYLPAKTLWTNSNLRNKLFIVTVGFLGSKLVYYSMQYNVDTIPGNPYTVFALMPLLEIPGLFVGWLLVERTGRVRLTAIAFILAAFTAALLPVIGQLSTPSVGTNLSLVVLAMLTKMFAVIAYTIVPPMCMEHSPTALRGRAFAVVSYMTGLGFNLMPVIRLSADFYKYTPMIAMAGICLLSAIAYNFLPETTGKPLPESMQDVFELGAVGWHSFLVNAGFLKPRLVNRKESGKQLLNRSLTSNSNVDELL